MDPVTPPKKSEPPPSSPRRTWLTWIVLAALLGAFYWWQASSSTAAQPEVDYSTVVQWARAGKVKSVVMRGDALTGELTAPESVEGGKPIKTFHTLAPAEDKNLVPMLEDKNVAIKV